MGNLIKGFDLIDISKFVISLNKKHQAILLSNLEFTLGKNHPKYTMIRKLVLDSTNDYCREIMNLLFGYDVEDG